MEETRSGHSGFAFEGLSLLDSSWPCGTAGDMAVASEGSDIMEGVSLLTTQRHTQPLRRLHVAGEGGEHTTRGVIHSVSDEPSSSL